MTSAAVKTFKVVGGFVIVLPGGRVRYLLQGWGTIVTARRENAYRQMYEQCGGVYEIVSEWDETGDQITSVSGSSTTRASAYGTNSGYGWKQRCRRLAYPRRALTALVHLEVAAQPSRH